MIDLIRKRHPSPSWIVVEELGNATGSYVNRHADAVAIGLWPSHGHELHGFEIKASRSDLKREFDDPSKADAVGKFCDFWWLVVTDLKILDGLAVPIAWGVLYPKGKVLRIHQKAPKRDATAITRGFSAALIRKVCLSWVPKHEHEELKKTARDEAMKQLTNDRAMERDIAVRELADLRKTIDRFQEHSGVDIAQRYHDDNMIGLSSWELEQIGTAVKIVREARELSGRSRFASDDPVALVKSELAGIVRAIGNHEMAIGNRRAAADRVRDLLTRLEADAKSEPFQLSLVEGIE